MRTSGKKILIAESSQIVAEGLKHILEAFGDYTVSGIIAPDTDSGLENSLDEYDADAVILDPAVLSPEGKTRARETVKRHLDVPVVGFISTASDASVASAFDACIYFTDKADDILQKISGVISSNPGESRGDGEELSAREKEILVCVAKGMLNKEIADQLCISIYTVITHRKNITRKTGIKTVAGLTVYALLNGLIDMNSVD